MESQYDQKAWEQETKLGRRLYIHNFGMTRHGVRRMGAGQNIGCKPRRPMGPKRYICGSARPAKRKSLFRSA